MWLWILATVVAFYVKGLCGFANTLVFTSILGFGTNNILISPVELALGYPTNLIMTWKNRKKLKTSIYLPLMILVLLGSVVGAFLLKNVAAHAVKILFGIVVILIGTEMLLREYSKVQLPQSKIVLIVIGILSGIMCGLFGVGALLAAYVGRVSESSDEFKANISAVFIVENTFRIILYVALGVISLVSFKQSLFLMPFMLSGLYLGMKSSQILYEKIVKRLVIFLLILSGVILILKNI